MTRRLLWFTYGICIGGSVASIFLGWIVLAFILLAGALWAGLNAGAE